ncbi:MAG: hypothetical protein OES84_01950 [Kiritimatiellaceae bacterium]|nr:hypothetical protein [Kiritimatiellaceae bacterium]
MFSKKKQNQTNEAISEAELLGEHFNSIRTAVLEIHSYKEKTIAPSPTYIYHKPINIEDAWPSCREAFIKMFGILNTIAIRFQLEPTDLPSDKTFTQAIETFVDTLDTITFGIADAVGTGIYSSEELDEIDDLVLSIQTSADRIQKFVLVDFPFPSESARPVIPTDD